MRWYILQAQVGSEKMLIDAINQQIERLSLQQDVAEVIAPTEEVVTVFRGQKKKQSKHLFPGYVFIKMNMSDSLYQIIRSLRRVYKFLGNAKPEPISEEEVHSVFANTKKDRLQKVLRPSFCIGEQIRICSGPFASFNGVVEEIDEDRERLKIMVSIFDRATPLELEFNQVEKLT